MVNNILYGLMEPAKSGAVTVAVNGSQLHDIWNNQLASATYTVTYEKPLAAIQTATTAVTVLVSTTIATSVATSIAATVASSVAASVGSSVGGGIGAGIGGGVSGSSSSALGSTGAGGGASAGNLFGMIGEPIILPLSPACQQSNSGKSPPQGMPRASR